MPGLLAAGKKEVRQPRAAVSLQVLSSRRHCLLEELLSEALKKKYKAELPFIKELKTGVCLVLMQFYTKIQLEKVLNLTQQHHVQHNDN